MAGQAFVPWSLFLILNSWVLQQPLAPSAQDAERLSDESLKTWSEMIFPSAEELKWRQLRWHTSLISAAEEARQRHRPILLWTMNGNPCGET